MSHDDYDIINTRYAACTACQAPGIHVDTTAGEILAHGEVVAVAPAGRTLLLVSEDGQDLLCDTCASR